MAECETIYIQASYTYQNGVPTNEFAGFTNDADPKSPEDKKQNKTKNNALCHCTYRHIYYKQKNYTLPYFGFIL